MNAIKKMKSGLITGFVLLLVSCNSWLDVDPQDRIMENTLFQDRAGFLTALNGIYAELNDQSLYGQNLTVGMIDVMAQYYNCSVENHNFATYMDYEYEGSSYKSKLNNIWSKSYALIANCNAIIEHCGEGNPLLPDVYYKMIKGEAIGMRAMLHLDLLRLYGPIWSEMDKEAVCIPYMTKSDRAIQPLLRTDSVMSCIVNDLNTASGLLETVDPVLTEGAGNAAAGIGGNDMNYRQYRLNYFAVNALLARAYLWCGNTLKAGEYARMVIEKGTDKEKPLFPLVDADYVSKHADRLFSPEVLFSLYLTSRSDKVYKSLFQPSLSSAQILTMAGDLTGGRVAGFYDDKNDLRYKMWEQTVQNNQTVTYFTKFKDETEKGAEAFRYMVPLIRMSEMYLIAAECETDLKTALDKYFNPLRFSRNCVNQNASSPEELYPLMKAEYMREFIGEGQLFFYYKRKGLQNIPDGATVNSMKNIGLTSYVFVLPDSETSQRTK